MFPFPFVRRELGHAGEDEYTGKYEQSVNMPKNFWKMANVRIFRQIPAKMRLESQCLCGFPEGTVEIEEARLGRWNTIHALI